MRLSVVLVLFFISSKDLHKKSRGLLISDSSDLPMELAVRFPAYFVCATLWIACG